MKRIEILLHPALLPKLQEILRTLEIDRFSLSPPRESHDLSGPTRSMGRGTVTTAIQSEIKAELFADKDMVIGIMSAIKQAFAAPAVGRVHIVITGIDHYIELKQGS